MKFIAASPKNTPYVRRNSKFRRDFLKLIRWSALSVEQLPATDPTVGPDIKANL